MALAVGGIDFEDVRRGSPAEDDLTANLGRFPVCIAKCGTTIGQSMAIWHYAASEAGLLGNNSVEASKVIAVVEHLRELSNGYSELVPFGAEPSDETLDKWFDQGATDATGPADGSARSTRYLKWWMGRIEAALDSHGFAVGDKLTFADVFMFYVFGDNLSAENAPTLSEAKRQPFCSKARTDALLDAHPKIKASVHAAANNSNMQKWLETRSVNYF
jgi:glutathione S-transferase